MNDYQLQLNRLKRHYDSSINTFDFISFLDLAHTLRIWMEIKDGIEKLYNIPTFKKIVITKTFKKLINNSGHAFAYFPDGVKISTKNGSLISKKVGYGPLKDSSTNSIYFYYGINEITLYQYLIVYRNFSENENKILDEELKNVNTELVTFTQFMKSPAIYFQIPGHNPKNISNEELIKRIANEYQASHADSKDTNFQINNIYSGPVNYLMGYGCLERLPLPYFVLLHIAGNIIKNLEGHIN
jgi:hypothetical protein